MIGLTLFVGVVIANFNENKVNTQASYIYFCIVLYLLNIVLSDKVRYYI